MTGHERGRTSARRGILRVFLMCVALLLVVTMVAHADGYDRAVQLKPNVVLLTIARDEETSYGCGFVVGEQDELLYIVTAWHVVSCDAPDCSVRVSAQFVGCPSPVDATVWRHDSGLDLAVLTTPRPPSSEYQWESEWYDSVNPAVGTEVWLVGRAQSWYIPLRGTPGHVERLSLAMTHLVVVDAAVQVGTSGAPMISEHGVVGMVQAATVSAEVDVLRIEIVRHAVTTWGAPWGLAECTGPPTIDLFASSNVDPLYYGEAVNLMWQVRDAARVALAPDGQELAMAGSVTVAPEETTTYTLRAESCKGLEARDVTVEVLKIRVARLFYEGEDGTYVYDIASWGSQTGRATGLSDMSVWTEMDVELADGRPWNGDTLKDVIDDAVAADPNLITGFAKCEVAGPRVVQVFITHGDMVLLIRELSEITVLVKVP